MKNGSIYPPSISKTYGEAIQKAKDTHEQTVSVCIYMPTPDDDKHFRGINVVDELDCNASISIEGALCEMVPN